MVVNHSIKQNGGLPGQDMSRFHFRFQQFFGAQNAEFLAPKNLAFGLISVAKDVAVLADQNEETAYENQGERDLCFFRLV